ncbi:MAG: HAD-IIIC family phosphatase [Pseudomonadota bacterium]
MQEKSLKCVVWDLDDTLWSGTLVEGDDVQLMPGIEDIIKTLDSYGVLQSIASKNNYDDAIEKLNKFGIAEYFLFPQVSWNPKSSAIGVIRDKLNISLDTFLFIDDQPYEQNEVSAQHPDIECLSAAAYVDLLAHSRIRNIQVTDDSKQRRLRYMENALRQNDEQEFVGTPEDFLATLDMVFTISVAKPEDLIRAEELTERTNQLNSTGITYDRDELAFFMSSPDHLLLVCDLTDRYGSYGKIGLALVETKNQIDTIKLLLMSCRTAARGVGSSLLIYLMKRAKERGHGLRANFRRTQRNRQMLATYQFANFKEISRDDENNILFECDLSTIQDYARYIKLIIDV